MVAAIVAARAGAKVTLYEAQEALGKKLLATGNGRCNIAHRTVAPSRFVTDNSAFVESLFVRIDSASIEAFFASIGLLWVWHEEGKAFPITYEAKSVVKALSLALQEVGVTVQLGQAVQTIVDTPKGYSVRTVDGSSATYTRVLIATGLDAAPQLGATQEALAWAKALGHSVVPTYPILVPLECAHTATMQGVRMRMEATLFIDNQKITSYIDDVLFTAYGLSGLAILDLSRYASAALAQSKRVKVTLDLLPSWSKNGLTQHFESAQKEFPKRDWLAVLSLLLPQKVAKELLKTLSIDGALPCGKEDARTLKRLVEGIKGWKFEITATHGAKHAEAMAGGIDTASIEVASMESRLKKGLFFAGEALDVAGDRGGFNLAFAWASGMVAGQALALKD